MKQILRISLQSADAEQTYPEQTALFQCEIDELADPAEFVDHVGSLAFKELNRRLREQPLEKEAA